LGSIANNAIALPMGNLMAPAWMLASPQVAGVRDIEWDLNLGPLTFAAATTTFATPNNGQMLQLDADQDYMVREIVFVIPAATAFSVRPSDLRVRIRDANGRLFTSDFVYATDLTGPLVIPWPLKRGGVLAFDFMNASATNSLNSVQVVLKGWKRAPCPEQEGMDNGYIPMRRRFATLPEYLRGADLEDYEYPFTFISAGKASLSKLPLQTDNDADFLWRGVAGDFNNPGAAPNQNPILTVGGVTLAFYDPTGTPLGSSPFLAAGFAQPVRGMVRECILSNGGGPPNPMYPEIFIPRGGVPQVDIFFSSANTVRFSLRGQKVYKPQTGL
jgi:hypothetical protein